MDIVGIVFIGLIALFICGYGLLEYREAKRLTAFADTLDTELHNLFNERILLLKKGKNLSEIDDLIPDIDVSASFDAFDNCGFFEKNWKSLIVYEEVDS